MQLDRLNLLDFNAMHEINPVSERPLSSSSSVHGNAISRSLAINMQALERTSDISSLTSDISCLLLSWLMLNYP